MKVKEWVDGKLILDGDLLEGAKEAFRELRYIEAFSILQGAIETFMIFIYQMRESTDMRRSEEVFYEKKYTFSILRNYIRDNSILSEPEVGKLDNFYELRKKIVHHLVRHAFQPRSKYRITPTEATKGFERGKELYRLLESKTEEVGMEITKSKPRSFATRNETPETDTS